MKNTTIKNTVLAARFLALAFILPFFTGQIQQIGSMLLPMHLPIIFCSVFCSKSYGFLVGLIAPVMRSAIFHMPPMYPTAISMSVKLAVLGFLIGYIYEKSKKQNITSLYIALIISILISRLFWAAAMSVLLGVGEGGFTLSMFFTMAFVKAFPGLILQFLIIPAVYYLKKKTSKPL